MGEVSQGPVEPNRHGHNYSLGYRTQDGYAVCCECGAPEDSGRAARECASRSHAAFVEKTRALVEAAKKYHRWNKGGGFEDELLAALADHPLSKEDS